MRHALATRFLATLAVLLAIGFPVAGWQQADASRDRTLELYTRAIGAELPADALYVTGGDVEALYGVPAPQGRRFPLAQQQFGLERYVTQVAPRLEPRVAGARTWSDVMAAAAEQGLTVAGSSPELLALPGAVPELRGLLFVATPGSAADLSREAVMAAVRLAPIAAELPVLPAQGHAFSRFHQRRFARAFAGAAEQLRRDGREALFRQAERAAAEIAEPSPGADRSLLLRAFADSARAAGY
ncbi:MAG: hypothetical protein IT348_01535 [Candidatus Eisenbacteria bacterium]|nr:hypothetical protein [Candidatus Eisenbacteria bacterium]